MVRSDGRTDPSLQRLAALSYGYEGRVEIHLYGGFADTKGVGAKLVGSLLAALHKQRTVLELVTLAVGEVGSSTFATNNTHFLDS